ncbi:MAG TPA: energy transducer TonB [Candidatus Aquilonibacter sp.]
MILTPIVVADTPTCAVPNRAASVVRTAMLEDPGMAEFPGWKIDVLVNVSLNAQGTLTDAHLIKSTGNRAADDEALRLARQSVYAAKIINCVPTSSTLIFHARIPAPHS